MEMDITDKLMHDLLNAQREITPIAPDTFHEETGTWYASVYAIREHITPVLTKNNLLFYISSMEITTPQTYIEGEGVILSKFHILEIHAYLYHREGSHLSYRVQVPLDLDDGDEIENPRGKAFSYAYTVGVAKLLLIPLNAVVLPIPARISPDQIAAINDALTTHEINPADFKRWLFARFESDSLDALPCNYFDEILSCIRKKTM